MWDGPICLLFWLQISQWQNDNISTFFRVIFRQMPIPARSTIHTTKPNQIMSCSVFKIFGIGFLSSSWHAKCISCIHLSPNNKNTRVSALQYIDRHASIHLSAIFNWHLKPDRKWTEPNTHPKHHFIFRCFVNVSWLLSCFSSNVQISFLFFSSKCWLHVSQYQSHCKVSHRRFSCLFVCM